MTSDTTVAAVLWRRLDVAGHDACRLVRLAAGWRLSGSAVFDHEGKPCLLNYVVDCDSNWRTRLATVVGWIAADNVTMEIVRAGAGEWLLNGVVQPQPAGCIDVDLGFTPATNLLAIRRLDLAIGEETTAPAAYLGFPELTLGLLEQSYRRTGETTFAYAAPAFDYVETLEIAPVGFVTNYPLLWSGEVISTA